MEIREGDYLCVPHVFVESEADRRSLKQFTEEPWKVTSLFWKPTLTPEGQYTAPFELRPVTH